MSDYSAGLSPAAQLPISPHIVAGIGLRRAASRDEILALLAAALTETGLDRGHLAALATLDGKAAHPAIVSAARWLDVPVLALPPSALRRPVPNPSARVARHLGLHSVAEAAAASFGPLLAEKQRSANVTCALSRLAPAYAPISRAASALSTLSTSTAGP